MSLLEYQQMSVPKAGADKYYGAVAGGYDKKREESPKWTIEQKIIEDMLSGYPVDTRVLDIPCGTGRFFDCYDRNGYIVAGVDKSEDMLKQAAAKIKSSKISLFLGDVRKLDMEDKSADVAVMCRLTRWLTPDECVMALKELQRVVKQRIIFTARVRNHPHARSYELIESALDGWKIARDEAGVDMDYRIIALEPAS